MTEVERYIQMRMPDVFWDMDEITRYREGILVCTDAARGLGKTYLYGVADMPIEGQSEPFRWGLWVEVSPADHDAYLKVMQTAEAEGLVIDGRLANTLPCYSEDVGTPVRLTCYANRRPSIEVLGNSPLADDQRTGYVDEDVVTLNRLFFGEDEEDLVEELMEGES